MTPPPRSKPNHLDARIWALTARMRTLVRRVQYEVIEPARKKLTEGTAQLAQSRAAAQSAITSAQSQVEKPRQEIGRLLNAARAHLAAQNVFVSHSAGTSEPLLGEPVDAHKQLQPLAEATSRMEYLTSLVEGDILKTAKPKAAWRPDSDGGGCAMLIAGFVLGAILASALKSFFGFVIGFLGVYVAVMWFLHKEPVSRLEQASRQANELGQHLLGLLEKHVGLVSNEAQQAISAAEKWFKSETATLERTLRPQVAALQQDVTSFVADCGYSGAEWTAHSWRDWSPAGSSAFAARFGLVIADPTDLSQHLPSLNLKFTLPALVPFPEGRCLLLKASGTEKDHAVNAVQSLLTRLLATIPPGKLRFTFIDPIALGNSVAPFMALSDHEESLVNSRAWSEPQHIEQRLGDLTEHMETVIQKYLRTEFKTIHDYNEAAQEVAEPYRFVVVFDFPVNFTDNSLRRLVSIARNGSRCGVYAIVVNDAAKSLPYGFSLSELEQTATVLAHSAAPPPGGFRWQDPDFQSWTIQFDAPAPRQIVERVVSSVGGLAKDAMRVEVPYDRLLAQAQLGADSWWKAESTKSIRIPLGPTGARKLQYLVLGEGMGHHALIVGRPGSGKSNLMHVIITTLALTYPPDEMRVYLIDFKKGVEFKSYADHKLPHAEAIAVESEREFGLSVVERLDLELKSRGDHFRAAGVANIAEYREKTSTQLPRVLLLVDEFQEFFTQDDFIARQTALILDRLVRQGRAFGIHVMLGSQTLAGSYNLSRSTLDQMAVRIAMQCSEADSRLILSDDNPAARLLSRPGEAIYNAASGLVEGNNLFQVARFSDEDREERLTLVSTIARNAGKPVPVPIVFEGNELAHLTDCRPLQRMLAADDWPSKKSVDLLLGDPIAIRDPISAQLRRQSGRHLLIISRDEAEGVGMCVASILSILAQHRPGTIKVFIADFTLADSEWAERAEEVEEFFPHEVKVLSRQREVAEVVRTLSDEVSRRTEADPDPCAIFLVLQGVQRMKVLRSEDESFSYSDDSATPSEKFAHILREGPEVGIHVIAWCDTVPNASRVADRRTMNEFGLRAGGVMSADDSHAFFDDAVASRIDKPHRIIFFDEERPGHLDKFRPYSMPPRQWLEMTGRALKGRTNHK